MAAVPDSYLNSVKNVSTMFGAIKTAGVPARFTHEFLKQLGVTSSADRAVIPVMKSLRFLDNTGVPTDRYRRFRDPTLSGAVMAEALRDAYSDLFTVHQKAPELTTGTLTGTFSRITGKGDAVSKKMAATFKALAGLADWSAPGEDAKEANDVAEVEEKTDAATKAEVAQKEPAQTPALSLRHDVHVHLPVSTDVKVYDAIFRSIREHLG